MQILIFFAVHGRKDILELFLLGIRRLEQYSGHDISTYAVCSTISDSELLAFHNINHMVTGNRPLSDKMEKGIKSAMAKPFDYLLTLGSDDLLDHNVFPKYYNALMTKQTPFFGMKKVGFIDAYSKQSCFMNYAPQVKTGYLMGAGRMLSRKSCDKMLKAPMYGVRQQHKGLDWDSERSLIDRGIKPHCVDVDRPMVVDVKSNKNIWSYEDMSRHGIPCDYANLTYFLSKQEQEYLDNFK